MLPECQLFGTLGCHLCEQAEGLLMPLVERGLLVELLDRADSGEELDWPFELEQVVLFLQR